MQYTSKTIRNAGNGCQESFEIILHEHRHFMKYLCNKFTLLAEYDDLFQGASLGMFDACKKFSNRPLGSFKNYAEKFMKGEIYRVIAEQRIIHFPIHVWQNLPRVNREIRKARDAGDTRDCRTIIMGMKDADKWGKYVIQAMMINVFKGDIDSLADNTVNDEDYYIPEIVTNTLTEQELDVVTFTFGLYGGEPLSVADTQERLKRKINVWKTHYRAIKKLRLAITSEKSLGSAS